MQYGAVLFGAAYHSKKLTIGDNVTIGQNAPLSGCAIGDGAVIGVRAKVDEDVIIGRNCIGSQRGHYCSIPEGSLVNAWGKVERNLGRRETEMMFRMHICDDADVHFDDLQEVA